MHPGTERMRRVAGQRGWSAQTLEARERAQWPCDEKRAGRCQNDAGLTARRSRRRTSRWQILDHGKRPVARVRPFGL